MNEEEIMAVAIGKPLPKNRQGFGEGEAIPQPYQVQGLPSWVDIKIYNTAGWRWHFSAELLDPAKKLRAVATVDCPSPGQTFGSATEVLAAVRAYLRSYATP